MFLQQNQVVEILITKRLVRNLTLVLSNNMELHDFGCDGIK